jgi:L-asparaginase
MALPRIHLICVSSTLGSQGRGSLDATHYGRASSGRPSLTPADLIERVPELSTFADPRADLDLASREHPNVFHQWPELVARIDELGADPDAAGIVITHGTNVLEETAYLLHLTVKHSKPVVLCGAQRPFTHLSTDGPLNLLSAFRTAASPDSAGRGVLVVLNDEVQCAREVTKTNTYRVETFQSPGLGFLGYADPDRVVFYRSPTRPHTTATPFRLGPRDALPRVDILYGYAGDDGSLVKAAVELGASGLVIAGVGAGSVGGMREALKGARDKGVVVVRSSRLGSGRVVPDDHYTEPGFVAADNLNPQKARVLLALALPLTKDPAEMQRIFDTY